MQARCSHIYVQSLVRAWEEQGTGQSWEWLCPHGRVLAQKSEESESISFEPGLLGVYGYMCIKVADSIFYLIVFSLVYHHPLFIPWGGSHK